MADEGAPEQVTLLDEQGHPREFFLHDAFDMDGATYFLVESTEDPEIVLLLRGSDEGLQTVDEQEFNNVLARLEQEDSDSG